MALRAWMLALAVAACGGRDDRAGDDKAVVKPDGFIGITFVWSEAGAEVDSVYPETPAERVGLRSGDVITLIGGRAPHDAEELQRRIIGAPIGSTLTLTVLRDGHEQEAQVRVTTWPAQLENARPAFARSELDRRRAPD